MNARQLADALKAQGVKAFGWRDPTRTESGEVFVSSAVSVMTPVPHFNSVLGEVVALKRNEVKHYGERRALLDLVKDIQAALAWVNA